MTGLCGARTPRTVMKEEGGAPRTRGRANLRGTPDAPSSFTRLSNRLAGRERLDFAASPATSSQPREPDGSALSFPGTGLRSRRCLITTAHVR
jgi:hypothetical protein